MATIVSIFTGTRKTSVSTPRQTRAPRKSYRQSSRPPPKRHICPLCEKEIPTGMERKADDRLYHDRCLTDADMDEAWDATVKDICYRFQRTVVAVNCDRFRETSDLINALLGPKPSAATVFEALATFSTFAHTDPFLDATDPRHLAVMRQAIGSALSTLRQYFITKAACKR